MSAVEEPAARITVELTINGTAVSREVPARRLLSDFLRDDLDLVGTRVGCEHGICGACTILIDGAPARACSTLAVQVDGATVTTIEGVTPDQGLSALQAAFHEHHALQCGFCTSGILMTLEGADPAEYQTDDEIRHLLSGNICRCTGYQHIVDAVKSAWGR